MSLLLRFLFACWIGFVVHAEEPTSPSRRPNVLLIFADDLGFGDLASYGHPFAVTPQIDRLAASGTAFRQFHVNGNICPITRAGLMTGRNPSWFPNYTDDYSFMGTTTITNVMQDAGYVTGHIGKWNIGPDYETEHVDYGIDDLRITGSIPNDPRGKEGLRFDVTIDFVEQYKDQPFYLNLWIYATHTPIQASPELVEQLADVTVDRSMFGQHMQEKFDFVEEEGGDLQEYMRIYLAEVLGLDIQVGRLLDKLEELGLREDTIVVFSSDNGPERLAKGRLEALGYSGGLRGEKHSFYEGGTRVPFIVSWPGKVPAGRVDDESIMFGSDWLTTVASVTGADFNKTRFEGEDMSDVWLGNTRSREAPLFFRQLRRFSKVYMRYGRWKLHKEERELYDLFTDPEEFTNIYDERPDIVEKLLVSMEAWETTLPTGHARLPEDELPFDPNEPAPVLIIPDIPGAFPPSPGTIFPPKQLTGDVFIRVGPVANDIEAVAKASTGYVNACGRFFRVHLPETFEDVHCKILSQELVFPTTDRRLERKLQDRSFIDSMVQVLGTTTTNNYKQEAFESSLPILINGHPDDFATALGMWDDFFVNVNTIQGLDPDGAIPDPDFPPAGSTNPPINTGDGGGDKVDKVDQGDTNRGTSSSNNGLSGGVIVAMIFAALLGLGIECY